MATASEMFFNELARHGHEVLLEKVVSGTVRFDLARGGRIERWHVAVEKGDVKVSRRNAAAECVVRMDAELFERIVSGEQNAMAAFIRGEVKIEGDLDLLMLFQRLFPGPPHTRDQVPAAGYARRQR
jgi:putative sterol carrier protein